MRSCHFPLTREVLDAEVAEVLRAGRTALSGPTLTGLRLPRATRLAPPGDGEDLRRGLWATLVRGLDRVEGLAACDADQMRAEAHETLRR